MSNFADVPVACTDSGAIYLLEAILPEQDDYRNAVEKLHQHGGNVVFSGKLCASCRFVKTLPASTCDYRPLKGPLFVPR